MTDGLSIRPQTLQLSPRYRRLRDTILRPHLRLTESRYFWERWKSRLGPDAAVLIMEVRDRCNRALAALPSGAGNGTPHGLSDTLNTAEESGSLADGCTVSASELAAACGFSRVTLWRILQREDVRRFVSVEHNYVYDRRLGKKRRTVSTYHVQMEDPLVEEDEARLQALLEAHGGVDAGATAREVSYPQPMLQNGTEVVDRRRPRLQLETASGGSIPKPRNVPETIENQRFGERDQTSSPRTARPSAPSALPSGPSAAAAAAAASAATATRPAGQSSGQPSARPSAPSADVDIWRRYPEIAHYVEEAEQLLGDAHSRGFYLKALKQLHPQYMDVWQRALGLAREQQHIRRSRGALFTRLLRTFAAEAGVTV